MIFFTFSSFCLDVIFSTNSWPSRIATSRDLYFQFMFVELISKLQIQIVAARFNMDNMDVESENGCICMSDGDDPDPYRATRGRACSLKLSYCNQILKLIRIKSNIISAQWSRAIYLALYVFPIRILMLYDNSWRWKKFCSNGGEGTFITSFGL